MKNRITIVLGTKAEFLRMFPLMLYLQKKGEPYDLIHTYQHELGDYLQTFGIKPAEFLEFPEYKNTGINAKGIKTGISLYRKLKKTFERSNPKWVVYQGDTFSTGVAAMAAKRAKVPSAHVEAGFRSHSSWEPFPEEIIRRIADHRATLNFIQSYADWESLQNEGIPTSKIVVSGSVVRDSVDYVLPLPNLKPIGDYAVVTIHRYENLFSQDRLKKILQIIDMVPCQVIWPMHIHTKLSLIRHGYFDSTTIRRLKIIPPMEYKDFMELVAGSRFTITDGGSLEEESIILSRKCLLLRKNTERLESVERGLTFLTGLDPTRAAIQLKIIESNPYVQPDANPYYLGRPASEIIGDRLLAG